MNYLTKKFTDEHKKTTVEFLKRTQDGEYSKVDSSAINYQRIKILREKPQNEIYYYGIR